VIVHINRRTAKRIPDPVHREHQVILVRARMMDESRIVRPVHQNIAPSKNKSRLADKMLLRREHRTAGAVQFTLLNRRNFDPGILARIRFRPLFDLFRQVSRHHDVIPETRAHECIDDMRNQRRPRDIEQRLGRIRSQIAQALAPSRRQQNRRRYFPCHAAKNSIAAVENAWLAGYSWI